MKPEDQASESPPLALRPVAAARMLGISVRTLRTWTADGIIPHVRIGGVLLYPYHVLQNWLALQSAGHTLEAVHGINRE